jgi:hypothetical protein
MNVCPDCTRVRPAAAFDRPRTGNPANDRLALAPRCNDCLSLHRARKHFTSTHRAAAKADPTSALAAEWRAVRFARLSTTARVRDAVAAMAPERALTVAA